MEIVRKINALLMVGVVYAMSLPTALSCCCDIGTSLPCSDACACEVTSCCSDCGSTQPEDNRPSLDCGSCCDCKCFYLETPIRAWKSNDDLVFTSEALALTALDPPLPVQASDRPADNSPCCITAHNVRQSQLCVWRK